MNHIVNLSEFSLIRFLILVTLGKKPFILSVHTAFPQTSGPLKRLAVWAENSGRARWAVELCPQLQRIWDYPPTVLLFDIFGKTEEWQDAYYRFDDAEQLAGQYALAYKHVTCAHTWAYHLGAITLAGIVGSGADRNLNFIGVPADMLALAIRYSGLPLDRDINPGWTPKRATNFLIFVLTIIKSLVFVLSRTKPGMLSPVPIFLAADHMEDFRDIPIFKTASGAGDVLLVGRMYFPKPDLLEGLENTHLCRPLDGSFSVVGAVRVFAMVLRDSFNLLKAFHGLEPGHFYRLATMPFRRAALKGLFNRYRPKYFWGRDPYNVDHILRHQELKKIGGVSLGISNEFPAYSILFPHGRYISFDRYFVYGTEMYENYYTEKWADDVSLVPTASFSLTQSQLEKATDEKPADIAFFTAVFIPEPKLVEIVRAIAKSFPNRKIYLQIKRNYHKMPISRDFIAACTDGLTNVQFCETDSVYDLLSKVRYSFSDPSSVIAEAVQMGVKSFALDISPLQESTIYRDYPGVCVSTAEQAVLKIQQIESKRWHYPLESLKNLIDLSGRTLAGAVCADMGLNINTPNNREAGEISNAGS